MSSDEDEDYMADSFVAKLVQEPAVPINRPISSQRRQKSPVLPVKKRRLGEIEKELRDKGLNEAISGDNKGFAMMARMGYRVGQSIGKSSTQGIVEPIGIQLKSDRGGLGREEALQQLRERRMEQIRKKRFGANDAKKEVSVDDFRRRLANQANERQLAADLGKCQRACEDLDQKQSITAPAMPWFWPDRSVPKVDGEENESDDSKTEDAPDSEEEDKEDDYEQSEKIEMLSTYLRTSYSYCHWCGIEYDDAIDLKTNCPGQTKDDH